jgi:hypothetical protein
MFMQFFLCLSYLVLICSVLYQYDCAFYASTVYCIIGATALENAERCARHRLIPPSPLQQVSE